MHTLVQRLLDNEVLQGSPEELDAFWKAVGEEGTPLLTALDGGDFNATFVYRTDVDDPSVITQVMIMWDGDEWPETAYWVDSLALTRMGRTDIWYGNVDLPDDFCGMYYVALANQDGIINEDVHEPWPMSFCDEMNPEPTREPDAIYPRNIVRTPKPNASPSLPRGTVRELSVDAAHLRLGRKLWRRSGQEIARPPAPEYPVWTYLPAASRIVGQSEALPVVVLLSGQFLEVADLKDFLDRSIDQGLVPPLAVVAPGRTIHGHNSWGYRRGFGPPDKALFLRESLWPLIRDSLDVRGPLHLVAWGQDAPTALRTAAGTRDLVDSLTLLNPILETLGPEDDDERDEEDVRPAIGEDLRGFDVVVGVPATRSGVFTWSDTAAKAGVLYDLSQVGVTIHRVVQSDPNIVAEIDTMIKGVALMVSS